MTLARISFLTMVLVGASMPAQGMMQGLARRFAQPRTQAVVGLRTVASTPPRIAPFTSRFFSNKVTAPLTLKEVRAEGDALVAGWVKEGSWKMVSRMLEGKEKRLVKPLTQEDYHDLGKLRVAHQQAEQINFIQQVKSYYAYIMDSGTSIQSLEESDSTNSSLADYFLKYPEIVTKDCVAKKNLSSLRLAVKKLEIEKNNIEVEVAKLQNSYDFSQRYDKEVELHLVKEDLARKNDELTSLYEEYIKDDNQGA